MRANPSFSTESAEGRQSDGTGVLKKADGISARTLGQVHRSISLFQQIKIIGISLDK
jgi:hypothetical protein